MELAAINDSYRESTESWTDLLRDARRRGIRAPVVAVGDSALGFPTPLFPQTKEQRRLFHKQANNLAALPKSAHPGVNAAMKEIWSAEDIDHTHPAIKTSEKAYGAKHTKAVTEILDDADVLLEFYHYPAEHRIHLHTTNPIEPTFTTARSRTKITEGPGSRATGIAMAFTLIEAARNRWRAVNPPHPVALVHAGARFERGVLIEREEAAAA